MKTYSLDVKCFVTVHVAAPDEATARTMASGVIDNIEGIEFHRAMDDGSKLVAWANSAGEDGDADLIEVME